MKVLRSTGIAPIEPFRKTYLRRSVLPLIAGDAIRRRHNLPDV